MKEIKAHFMGFGIFQKGQKCTLDVRFIECSLALGFCTSCFRSARRIITALPTYSIVVYNYICNIWYMRGGLIFSNLKYPFLGYERK